ncbi:MAG: DUF2269 family protein [Lacisediminihabitans sp.]
MDILFNALHVVASVFIIGPMAILPMTGMRAIRAGQAGQVTTLAKSVYVFSLLSIVVAFFGFGALGVSNPKDHYSFSSPWIWISLVLYAVALLLNLFVVVPALRSAAGALTVDKASAAPTPGAKVPGYSRVAMGSGIVSLLLVLVVVLMVWKP